MRLKRRRTEDAERALPPPQAEQAASNAAEHGAQAEVAPADPSGRWIGYIDSISRGLITGWCFDKENPARRAVVEAVASNGRSTRTIAATFRQDVKDAGHGDGSYGFEIDIAPLDLKQETLIVRFSESKMPISKSPIFIDPQRSLLVEDLPSSFAKALRMAAAEIRAKADENPSMVSGDA